MTTRRAPRRDEAGFTLMELIVAIAISFLIVGPITSAIIIGLRTTDSSSLRLSQTRDIELVQGTLPRDVFTAQAVLPNAPAASTCANKVSLLKMTWSTPTPVGVGGVGPPTTSTVNYEVDYVYTLNPVNPPTHQTASLTRQLYSGSCTPVPGSETVLATSLHNNLQPNLQTATVSGPTSGATVTLSLTDSTCAKFTASAQERSAPATTAAPTTTVAPACTP